MASFTDIANKPWHICSPSPSHSLTHSPPSPPLPLHISHHKGSTYSWHQRLLCSGRVNVRMFKYHLLLPGEYLAYCHEPCLNETENSVTNLKMKNFLTILMFGLRASVVIRTPPPRQYFKQKARGLVRRP